jgi:hypothetical protein
MTDGLLNLALQRPGYAPHTRFFEPLVQFCSQAEEPHEASAQLSAFLASERVCARTDDDKTLVVAARHEGR